MYSLHLPTEITDELGYGSIPGDDQPGDYRKAGVDFQPIEWVQDINNYSNPNSRAIYYDAATRQYMQYVNDEWAVVPGGKMDQILEDKAYIDMPNQTYFTFLNPRQIFFGMSITYRF
jgi:hypothetical protein